MKRCWIVTIMLAFGATALVGSTGCQRQLLSLRGARCRPSLPGLSIFRTPRATVMPEYPPRGAVPACPACGAPQGCGAPQTTYDPAGPPYAAPPTMSSEPIMEYQPGVPESSIPGSTTRYAPVWRDNVITEGTTVVIPGPEAAPAPSR